MIALEYILAFFTILLFYKGDETNQLKYTVSGGIGLLLYICLSFIDIIKEC